MRPVFGRLLMASLGLLLYTAAAAIAAPSPSTANEPTLGSSDEARSATATDEGSGDEEDSGSEESGSNDSD